MHISDLLDPLQQAAVSCTPPATTDDSSEGRVISSSTEYSVPKNAKTVPSDELRQSLATTILDPSEVDAVSLGNRTASLYERGEVGVSLRRSKLAVQCQACHFGECDDSNCGCYRLTNPQARLRFRQLVAEVVDSALRDSSLEQSSLPVRYVTLGSGALLTDFEILLDLWSRGLTIESIVAIDMAYSGDDSDAFFGGYRRALSGLATFFAPARVFSFRHASDYLKAVEERQSLFGDANVFVSCDAAGVGHDLTMSVMASALSPGHMAFELSNAGRRGGHTTSRSPLEAYLPLSLQIKWQEGDGASFSMRCLRRKPGSTKRAAALPSQVLEDVTDLPSQVSSRALGFESHMLSLEKRAEALSILRGGARARAAEHSLRVFRVVYAQGRMPVRAEPSRDAPLAGSRAMGDEVIAEEVRGDGWVRLSSSLDTYAGYENHSASGAAMWMLTHAEDVGQLLEEVPIDCRGEAIDDDGWMPDWV
jgi:hypothetical protein